MKPKRRFKIVFYVPQSHGDLLRDAIARAGAGEIGNYTHCTFTTLGYTRFMPGKNSHPTKGEEGKLQTVMEERVETVCEETCVRNVLRAIRDAHPYEEPATDVYSIELFE